MVKKYFFTFGIDTFEISAKKRNFQYVRPQLLKPYPVKKAKKSYHIFICRMGTYNFKQGIRKQLIRPRKQGAAPHSIEGFGG